ncbi:rab6-interacting hypothetical protein [Limosa lapponica baueri]|uniref:RAB6-interacting golgin n=1 Tax=Limosa lapponica baueri TaxID=1758121 RepID=A0A2I0U1Z9_LIMLA|nr:rab6-interacting hypothetical protein [Limosa lapponica baueri]
MLAESSSLGGPDFKAGVLGGLSCEPTIILLSGRAKRRGVLEKDVGDAQEKKFIPERRQMLISDKEEVIATAIVRLCALGHGADGATAMPRSTVGTTSCRRSLVHTRADWEPKNSMARIQHNKLESSWLWPHMGGSKRTQAETVKLKRIQKELQALDDMVSADIGILRNRIDQASLDYSYAR